MENGSSRVQPTYVLDIAEAVTKALMSKDSKVGGRWWGSKVVMSMRKQGIGSALDLGYQDIRSALNISAFLHAVGVVRTPNLCVTPCLR